MLQIFIVLFIYLVVLFSYFFVKHTLNKKRTTALISLIKNQTIGEIKNVKAEVFTGGARNWNFNFIRCDIYVLPDAIFLSTYRWMIKGKPVFITRHYEAYRQIISQYALVHVKKINPDSYGQSVYLEYQYHNTEYEKLNIDVHLYGLTNAQREYFRF